MVALLLAMSLAIASSLVGTKLLMEWLIARHVGQPIHEDVPEGHTVKAGTPTMGGLAIVGAAIIDAVRAGMASTTGCTVEPDRRAAIATAIGEAGPGDVVLIAGKGHETVQVVGDREVPFDDRVEARAALQARRGSGAW